MVKKIALLSILFVSFLLVRTLRFNELFTFVYDQASFSITALEIFQSHKIQLIGPSVSFKLFGREVFQGGLIYYFQLLFLLLGNFDPKLATYLFIIFSGLMIFPLYYGVKLLINEKAAIFMVVLYSFLPFYVHSTMSLWNPYFQFALTPLLILFLGLFHKNPKKLTFLIISFLSGALFQFHYQYVLIITGLLIYYFGIRKLNIQYLLVFLLGLIIGYSPLIIFEFRNNFYNTRTIILFVTHLRQILGTGGYAAFNLYYLLSISFFVFLITAYILRNKLYNVGLFIIFSALLLWSINIFIVNPQREDVSKYWSYSDELKVYKIIRHNSIRRYNIASFYDTQATTQKYFLKKDKISIEFNNYQTNPYLYVIYPNNQDFRNNNAYELNTFKPSTIVKTYIINSHYNLYLVKRTVEHE